MVAASADQFACKAVLTLLKVVFRLFPTAVIETIITTEIRAAIRPYSMAVTPDSSNAKREKIDFIGRLPYFPVTLRGSL
jgi:hypothetical protein